MSDILRKIEAYKRTEISEAKVRVPFATLERKVREADPARGFIRALRDKVSAGTPALIAEVKKASPSKGLIRADFDPPMLARAYEANGAACLSVLTDGPSFQGKLDDLVAARSAVRLPVLRKDFLFDPYQVYQARAAGADCILIIMACVNDREAKALNAAAHDLNMDVLAEAHDETELDRALALETQLVGHQQPQFARFHRLARTQRALVPAHPQGKAGGGGKRHRLARRYFTTAQGGRERVSGGRDADAAGRCRRRHPRAAGDALNRMTAEKLTHLNEAGEARMVDVSGKARTTREAVAQGLVVMAPETLALCLSGQAKKGDVFGAARIAGIFAAKKTHELIPLCHPLLLSKVEVDVAPDEGLLGLRVTARVKILGETGVEMEALTAVSVACLTIYDMLKAADRGMRIEAVKLLLKTGGKSGDYFGDGGPGLRESGDS